MSDRDITRRNFMVRTIIGIIVFISAVLAIPFGGFGILPALSKKETGWSDVGTIADLAVNEPQERRFMQLVKSGWQEEKLERSLWLVKRPDGLVTAFSPNCPHLGCGYRWFDSDQRFKCPCHGSVFDINGKVVSGPAPRPLDTLDTRVEEGKVFVKYEVFQLGISSKVAA
ncbi:MAG TPA: ubiquinol-cytochrome c reductase iron-sulfur subunit [Nitrospirota bacterium]|nr:ubiquinol-cytochrome c reductase iron-sulfur subunit [Nitrospirota bacterium]